MARLLTTGAEGNHVTFEGGSVGGSGSSIQSTTVRSGTYAYEYDSAAGATSSFTTYTFTGVAGRRYWLRSYFRFDNLPSTDCALLTFAATGRTISGRLKTTGKLALWDITAGSQIGSDSAVTITTGTWYRIELSMVLGTGAVDGADLRLDGTTVASVSSQSWSDNNITSCDWGWRTGPGANKVCYVDDVALNDDDGSDQNSWPGEGSVLLLVPASDNARDSLWTGGAGGTTNLYDAVNNLPPIGTASETDLTQIEHAGSAGGSTDRYDTNLTTYTAAGVPSGNVISVAQIVVAHGEDVSTGSKLLSAELLSNPVISAGSDFTAGDDVGALGSYPNSWRHYRSAPTYSPGVTLGTAPVLRIRRPETASRVASVCFMGLMVEYVQGSPTFARPPFQKHTHQVWNRRRVW